MVFIQRIDYIRDILAHIDLGVPLALLERVGTVNQVGREYLRENAVVIGFVKAFESVAEQTEGREHKYALGSPLLQLRRDVDDRTARRNHIVDDDSVFAVQVATEVFMRLDRVRTVDDYRVIAPLVEHTEVEPEHRRIVHTPAHSALVRRYHGKMVAIELDVRNVLAECLDHLIGAAHIVKAGERYRVLHARIVRVERDDIRNAHVNQLLQSYGAVERFAGGALVLPALVEHRHYNRNAARLAADRADHSLQVLEVVVGAHRNIHSVHLVGHAVIKAVADDVDVLTAHRLQNMSFRLAGAEARQVCLRDKSLRGLVPVL